MYNILADEEIRSKQVAFILVIDKGIDFLNNSKEEHK